MSSIGLFAAIVSMITGIGNLALGIASRRYKIKHAHPKLRVIPKLAFPGPLDEMVDETYFDDRVKDAMLRLKTYACVEITNFGPNPQTILEAGFIDSEGIRIPWRNPEYIHPERSFPLVIAPDETVSIYIRVWPRDPNKIHAGAYAKTDCGDEFTGTSPIITDFLMHADAINKKAA